MRSAEFSVIVLNWNGRRFLNDCLTSLRQQTYRSFEVILVDNGSEDGSADFVRENFPEVRVVALNENKGFCGGNNEGIRKSSGEWIILLNNDTEAHPGCLEAVSEASQRYPDVAMFAPKMVFYDDRAKINNCGFMASVAGNAWEIGRNSKDGPEFNQDLQPFGPSGGAAFYRRDLLEEVGLLDEDFFMFYEDYDLAFRARLQGYRCRFVPGAVIYHRHGGTIRSYPARRVFFSQRNVEYTYIKNMPSGLILRYGAYHLIYDLGALVYFTRVGHLRPFLRAKWDALKGLRGMLRKRKEIQRNRLLASKQVRRLLVSNWFGLGFRKALGR